MASTWTDFNSRALKPVFSLSDNDTYLEQNHLTSIYVTFSFPYSLEETFVVLKDFGLYLKNDTTSKIMVIINQFYRLLTRQHLRTKPM